MDLDTDLEDPSIFAVNVLYIRRNHGITGRILRILSFHGKGCLPQAQVEHSGIPGFRELLDTLEFQDSGSSCIFRNSRIQADLGYSGIPGFREFLDILEFHDFQDSGRSCILWNSRVLGAPGHFGIPGFRELLDNLEFQGALSTHALPYGNVAAWIQKEAGKP